MPYSSSQTHMQQGDTMMENRGFVGHACPLPRPIPSRTCFCWEGCHSSSTPLARTVAVRGKPKETTGMNSFGWLVLSDLGSHHGEAGPFGASTYKETTVSGDQLADCSAGSSQIFRQHPEKAQRQTKLPTRLRRLLVEKQHSAVWCSASPRRALRQLRQYNINTA